VIAAIPPREADHLIQLNSANILPLCWKTSIYGRTLATRNEDLERRRSEQLPAVAFAYLCQLAAGPLLLFYQPARLGRGIEKQHPSGFRTGALPGMRRAAVRRPVSNPLSDTWADTTTSHGRLMLTVLGGLADDAECAVMRSDAIEIHEPRGFQRCGAPHNPGPLVGPSA
jgi:hypothetical protein